MNHWVLLLQSGIVGLLVALVPLGGAAAKEHKEEQDMTPRLNRIILPVRDIETAVEFGRLSNKDGAWKFEAVGRGDEGGLQTYVNKYT